MRESTRDARAIKDGEAVHVVFARLKGALLHLDQIAAVCLGGEFEDRLRLPAIRMQDFLAIGVEDRESWACRAIECSGAKVQCEALARPGVEPIKIAIRAAGKHAVNDAGSGNGLRRLAFVVGLLLDGLGQHADREATWLREPFAGKRPNI